MMDYTALTTEIQTGPLAAELAPFVASGNDAAIADILNDKTRGETMLSARLISARGVLADYPDGPATLPNPMTGARSSPGRVSPSRTRLMLRDWLLNGYANRN